MLRLAILCCILFSKIAAIDMLSNVLPSSYASGVKLQDVMFTVENQMNNGAAVEVHLVIAYTSTLSDTLKKMPSYQYFRQASQIAKDFPEKVKILKWTLPAKPRTSDWVPIDYPTYNPPVAAYIFANYGDSTSTTTTSGSSDVIFSTSGKHHRATIPPSCKKLKITLGKDDFSISDEEENDEESSESAEEEDENTQTEHTLTESEDDSSEE